MTGRYVSDYFVVCSKCGKLLSDRRLSNFVTRTIIICQKCYLHGSSNPLWKGDAVGYTALHEWIRNHKAKPALCEICKTRIPCDVANISGQYKRDVNDFKWLCRSCHMKSDGRINNLKGVC